MSDVAIRVAGLGKQYRIVQQERYSTLRDSVSRVVSKPLRWLRPATASRNGYENFWALSDVSFDILNGDVVGIIGRNGAGKSTLLKILSRITEPTTGEVDIFGRVGSLLEVGTGFHPELTGRENIYLNGAILGMRRMEIAQKLDEIVAFAEVEKFLDTAAKFYSSGMYMRLAFSVAAHLDPEILIVDEVLAVGDATFQRKCLGRMKDISQSGRTVLFVSHSMSTVLNLCSRAFYLRGGKLEMAGPVRPVVEQYMRELSTTNGGAIDLSGHATRRRGVAPLIKSVQLLNERHELTDTFGCGESISIRFELMPERRLERPHLGIGVDDMVGQRVFSVTTSLSDAELPAIDRRAVITCEIPSIPLAPGDYTLSLSAGTYDNNLMDNLSNAVNIRIVAADFFGNGRMPPTGLGQVLVKSSWSMRE